VAEQAAVEMTAVLANMLEAALAGGLLPVSVGDHVIPPSERVAIT
jgi:hypothetical protein